MKPSTKPDALCAKNDVLGDEVDALATKSKDGFLRASDGRFSSGGAGGPGRKPGVPNKTTALVKDAIEQTFLGLGGIPGLLKWAEQNQTTFYSQILIKLLPAEVKLEGSIQHDFAHILERARQRSNRVIDVEAVKESE